MDNIKHCQYDASFFPVWTDLTEAIGSLSNPNDANNENVKKGAEQQPYMCITLSRVNFLDVHRMTKDVKLPIKCEVL